MKKTVAVFIKHPECSLDSANGIKTALSSEYNIKTFSVNDIKPSLFKGLDVIAFPGGIGDSDKYYDFVGRKAGNLIEDFVNDGGHYLGICMGAYWAGHHYLDILDGVKCEQYIKRKTSDIKRSYGTIATVDRNGKSEDMFFYDGCALIGDERKFKTIARYSNGDPMAIIQNRIGIIGCHPESTKHWYEKPYDYINKYWHNGSHHNLLLDFTNTLTQT